MKLRISSKIQEELLLSLSTTYILNIQNIKHNPALYSYINLISTFPSIIIAPNHEILLRILRAYYIVDILNDEELLQIYDKEYPIISN